MHRRTKPVVWPLLSHGAPVPVSQPQHSAYINRLSFIAVWQKPMRLEQYPPKTTTLSWGIIQSPNIRGNGRTLLHLSSNKNAPWRKTQGRDAPLLSDLAGTRKTGCDGFLRPRLLVKPALKLWEQTVPAFMHVYKKSSLLCLWLHLEADKCVKRSLQLSQWHDYYNEALNSLQASGHVGQLSVAEEKALLIWTVNHCAAVIAQVTVVCYAVTTLHLILVIAKALVQRCDSMP